MLPSGITTAQNLSSLVSIRLGMVNRSKLSQNRVMDEFVARCSLFPAIPRSAGPGYYLLVLTGRLYLSPVGAIDSRPVL